MKVVLKEGAAAAAFFFAVADSLAGSVFGFNVGVTTIKSAFAFSATSNHSFDNPYQVGRAQ